MNRFSARSYRNLLGVSPELVAVATLALERSQIDFAITEGVRTLKRPGPVVSIPDSSADRTDAAASADALSGIDVLQWYPAQPDWDVFGKLSLDRYTPERIYQPEGALPTTEDVAYEQRVRASDGTRVIGNNTQP